jgi:hypothetical protein
MEQRKLRIKIEDLPKDLKISDEEMRKIMGGIDTVPLPESPVLKYYTSYNFGSYFSRYGQSGGGCGCGCG